MRLGWVVLIALTAIPLAGCATATQVASMPWLNRFRPARTAISGPDVIMIELALIERQVGDPFINKDLWFLADEQVIPLESKVGLETNGFRLGQVSGMTPSGLHTLLTSKQSNVNPRRFFLRANHSNCVNLGSTCKLCQFRFHQDQSDSEIALDQADCLLQLTPIPTTGNRVRLRFVPVIRHGETVTATRPTEDGSSFVLVPEKPSKTFDSLAFEITLDTNQYVVLGARDDRPETMGSSCFIRSDETVPVQRLLVLRACRAGLAPPWEAEDMADAEHTHSKVPPVAFLAALPAHP